MQLELPDGKVLKDPSIEAIAEAVMELGGRKLTLVNEKEENAFIRARGGPDVYSLEFRDGLTQRHFTSAGHPNSDDVILAMKQYLKGDHTYRQALRWQEVMKEPGVTTKWSDPLPDQVERGGCTSVLAIGLLIGLLVALLSGCGG